jgi:hypothetical protein
MLAKTWPEPRATVKPITTKVHFIKYLPVYFVHYFLNVFIRPKTAHAAPPHTIRRRLVRDSRHDFFIDA